MKVYMHKKVNGQWEIKEFKASVQELNGKIYLLNEKDLSCFLFNRIYILRTIYSCNLLNKTQLDKIDKYIIGR